MRHQPVPAGCYTRPVDGASVTIRIVGTCPSDRFGSRLGLAALAVNRKGGPGQGLAARARPASNGRRAGSPFMVQAFAVLLLSQLAGEGAVHATGLPVPGPVVGLVILALALAVRERGAARREPLADTSLSVAANGLLGHLSLLFVPAAVGVVQQGGILAAQGLAIGLALVASTILTLAVTAAVFVWTARLLAPGEPGR